MVIRVPSGRVKFSVNSTNLGHETRRRGIDQYFDEAMSGLKLSIPSGRSP
ncbi:hypothetical protein ACQI4L_02210 [Mycolicibacterium litorale]